MLAIFETNDFGQEAGHLIILLLGNKEEEEIASKVSKFLQHGKWPTHYTNHTPYCPAKNYREDVDVKPRYLKCYVCGIVRNFARYCEEKIPCEMESLKLNLE